MAASAGDLHEIGRDVVNAAVDCTVRMTDHDDTFYV